jgi:DNA-binding HxlR family transcriptional regulator
MQDDQKIMYSAEDMKACPVDTTSRIIGKKFTVLLIRNNMSNHKVQPISRIHRRDEPKDTFCKAKGDGKERTGYEKGLC